MKTNVIRNARLHNTSNKVFWVWKTPIDADAVPDPAGKRISLDRLSTWFGFSSTLFWPRRGQENSGTKRWIRLAGDLPFTLEYTCDLAEYTRRRQPRTPQATERIAPRHHNATYLPLTSSYFPAAATTPSSRRDSASASFNVAVCGAHIRASAQQDRSKTERKIIFLIGSPLPSRSFLSKVELVVEYIVRHLSPVPHRSTTISLVASTTPLPAKAHLIHGWCCSSKAFDVGCTMYRDID